MFFDVDNNWKYILNDFIISEEFKEIERKVLFEYNNNCIYPCKEDIFRAFKITDYYDVKVVILGQDPYFNKNEADGLAFSCSNKTILPPSLKNIFKELNDDLNILKKNGDLLSWAQNGVLLLNTILTVEAGNPNSHKKIGWENFTDYVIMKLNEREKPIVFILWGTNAIKKEKFIASNHKIIKSAHPSPLSSYRGFFGSRPFSHANKLLKDIGDEPINW